MHLSESNILDTLNTDILPCFDAYNPDTYEFTAVYRATRILHINGENMAVTLNTGHIIMVPLTYLANPAEYKALVLKKVSESLPD